jgi:hypothetical protein
VGPLAESNTLFRIVVILGFLFLLVGIGGSQALFPGSDAAWTSFRNSLSTGPQFPTFQNPFSTNYITAITVPDRNGATSGHESVFGCAAASYWMCLQSNDGDTSYVVLNNTVDGGSLDAIHTSGYVNVHFNNLTAGNVVSLVLTVWCRGIGNATRSQNAHVDGNRELYPTVSCPVSDTYQAIRITITQMPPVWKLSELNNASSGYTLAFQGPAGKVRVTYMELQVGQDTGQTGDCVGNFFQVTGCQIGRFFTNFAKAIVFFFNGLVFIVASIVAILTFVISIIVGLFIGLFTTMGWFLAVPGAPPTVQGIIAAIFVGMIAWILYLILKTVRGTSTI